MLDRKEAIDWYKRIQNGEGVDRYDLKLLEAIGRGRIAENLWDDGAFTLGIEYGVMIALVRLYDIKPEEVGRREEA